MRPSYFAFAIMYPADHLSALLSPWHTRRRPDTEVTVILAVFLIPYAPMCVNKQAGAILTVP
jgi:hypothetical protein